MSSQAPRGPTAAERSPFRWADGPGGCGGDTLGFRDWSWGWGESPLCGGDTASLGARGRPWILRVTSRGHWLCLCSGHLPAPTPEVSPHLSVSPSVPALQPLPKHLHPHSPSHVLSHVCPPRHRAPLGSWSHPSRPSRAPAMRTEVLCSWESKGSGSFAPSPVSCAPLPGACRPPSELPRSGRGRQTRTPHGSGFRTGQLLSPLQAEPGPQAPPPSGLTWPPRLLLSGPATLRPL